MFAPAAPSLAFSFCSFEQLPEPVEALVEHPPVHLHPVLDVVEAPRAHAAVPGSPHLLAGHELGVLEHADVLLDSREGDAERLSQLADARAAAAEPLEDAPASRVGERGEGPVEL